MVDRRALRQLLPLLAFSLSLLAGCMPRTALDKAANLYVANDCEAALRVIDKALVSDAANDELWFLRGEVNTQLEKYSAAVDDYTRVVELKPKQPDAFLRRAELYQRLGNETAAKSDIATANQLDTSRETSMLVEAKVRWGLGDIDTTTTSDDAETPDVGIAGMKARNEASGAGYLEDHDATRPEDHDRVHLATDADGQQQPAATPIPSPAASPIEPARSLFSRPVAADPLNSKRKVATDDTNGRRRENEPDTDQLVQQPAPPAGEPQRLNDDREVLAPDQQTELSPENRPPMAQPYRWNQHPGTFPALPEPSRSATGIRSSDEGEIAGRTPLAPLPPNSRPWGPANGLPGVNEADPRGMSAGRFPSAPATGIRSGVDTSDLPKQFGHGRAIAPHHQAFGGNTLGGITLGGGFRSAVPFGSLPQPVRPQFDRSFASGNGQNPPHPTSGLPGINSNGTGTMAPLINPTSPLDPRTLGGATSVPRPYVGAGTGNVADPAGLPMPYRRVPRSSNATPPTSMALPGTAR